MTRHKIVLIWAQDTKGVIGSLNSIPWSIPQDMQRFKAMTQGHTVIMGRKTWESLPPRFRPLLNRKNIVISEQGKAEDFPGALHAKSILAAADLLGPLDECIYVIGGGAIYQAFMKLADRIERTLIHGDYMGDVYAPVINDQEWVIVKTEPHVQDGNLRFDFQTWERKPGERRRLVGEYSNHMDIGAALDVPQTSTAITAPSKKDKNSAGEQKKLAISPELLGIGGGLIFGDFVTQSRMAMFPSHTGTMAPRGFEKDGKFEIDSYSIVATEDDYKR